MTFALGLSLVSCTRCGVSPVENESKAKAVNVYQVVTGEDIEQDRTHWDSLYEKNVGYVFGKEPASSFRVAAKAWRDVWSAGQGIENLNRLESVAEIVARLEREYQEARRDLEGRAVQQPSRISRKPLIPRHCEEA